MKASLKIAFLSTFLISSASALDLSRYEMVDLTHAFNEDTVYWPTAPTRFEKKELAYGETEDGYFYSAYTVCTPEHGGTHLDAPVHFAKDGRAAHEMPLEQLIAPGVVIDVSEEVAGNKDYRLTADDVEAFEAEHGRIEAGTIVLMRTGYRLQTLRCWRCL